MQVIRRIYGSVVVYGCVAVVVALGAPARTWSPQEQAFLEASENAEANRQDVTVLKQLTETSQQLLNYYTETELKIDPYDLDARIRWYSEALRTGNPLFDRTLDQKMEDLVKSRTILVKRIEEAGVEKDVLRRLTVLRDIENYKPFFPQITGLENSTAQVLFDDYKKVKPGPPRLQFLKNYQSFARSAVGAQFFARVRLDFQSDIEAAIRERQWVKAGALADAALQLWPSEAFFQDTARKYLENY